MSKKPRRLIKDRSINTTRVVKAASVVFFVIFIGVFVQYSVFHVVKGKKITSDDYARFISAQNEQPPRGNILTSDKKILAEDSTVYDMYAILSKDYVDNNQKPLYVQNVKKTAKQLSKIIDMKEKDIEKRLKKKGLYQVEFGAAGRNLTIEQHDKILKEKIQGIQFTEKRSRLYPNGNFASHVVGLTKTTENKLGVTKTTGIMGIEQSQNKALAGKDGTYSGNEGRTVTPTPGDDVYLTLDSGLQTTLENNMEIMGKSMKPKQSAAIVMDVKTGAILAASQRPSFNGNDQKGLTDMWSNLLVENPYEPGSTMKTLTLGASINEGIWQPNKKFDSGTLEVAGGIVNDFDKNMGRISYREGYARSSNVAFANMQQKMGDKTWNKYLKKFGFGKQTNTGFLNEASGLINYKSPLSRVNTSFGQGITVTPVQMVRAYSAMANGGKMVTPYIIDKIVDKDNNIKYQPKVEYSKQVVKKSTAKEVLKDMQDVVTMEHGTAKNYSLEEYGYKIGAKTGTAQLVVNGQYTNNYTDSTHSVAILAPADDPKILVYMYIMQPKSFIGGQADASLSSVLKPVLLQAINDLDKPKETTSSMREVPHVTGKSVDTAKTSLEQQGYQVITVGNGNKVISQSSPGGIQLISGSKIFLYTGGEVTMPDMQGWTVHDVITFSNISGIKVSVQGAGNVISQNIIVDTKLKKGDKLEVTLR